MSRESRGRNVGRSREPGEDEEEQPAAEEANRPIHEIRFGRIKAAIWANESESGTRHSVTLARLYKVDGDPTWRQSTTFNRDDLPLVAKVADLAHTYIFGVGQAEQQA